MVQGLIDRLVQCGAWDRVTTWDEATWLYLALVPLRPAWVELAPERKVEQDRPQTRLAELRGKLLFPTGSDRPRSFDPAWLALRR
ncbi:MAG TPA: hypothetical protein VFF52_16880 [Isosphaeraceae bacterium]|nr:hypothetical protein [Isosphaeraceae bacterium]